MGTHSETLVMRNLRMIAYMVEVLAQSPSPDGYEILELLVDDTRKLAERDNSAKNA